MKKILVTGSAGFAGRWMVRLLLQRGYQVVGGVRRIDQPVTTHQEILLDLEDPSSVFSAIQEVRPDGIVHLAGFASPHLANNRPESAYQVNFLGTHRVLDACRVLGLAPRVVLAGSATVYGKVEPSDLPLREERPVAPGDPYALAKASAEMLARVFSDHVPVVVARPFNHTGPGQLTDFVLPATASQIAQIEAGSKEPVLSLGDLSTERDFLDVRDVVEAYLLLLEAGEPGRVYNVCSGTCKPVHAWVEGLVALSRRSMELRMEPSRVFAQHNPRLVGDNSRLRALGWQRRVDPATMLTDLLDHWREKIARP